MWSTQTAWFDITVGSRPNALGSDSALPTQTPSFRPCVLDTIRHNLDSNQGSTQTWHASTTEAPTPRIVDQRTVARCVRRWSSRCCCAPRSLLERRPLRHCRGASSMRPEHSFPVPSIRVRDESIGFDVSVRADPEGRYHSPRFPTGSTRSRLRRPGFRTELIEALNVDVGPHAGARLPPGRWRTSRRRCVVRAEVPLVDRATATVGHVVTAETVQQIPLNGRHFTDLGLLVPGSVAPSQTGFSSRPIRGIGALAFNTAGNREEAVGFLVNGVTTNNLTFGSLIFEPPLAQHPGIQGRQLGARRRARSRVRRDRQHRHAIGHRQRSRRRVRVLCGTMRSTRATSSSSRRPIRTRSSATSSADRSAARSGAGGRSSSPRTRASDSGRAST